MEMEKEDLIKALNCGAEVVLIGEFTDGETEWTYEYWRLTENESYQCSYDGEYSHWFRAEDLDHSFKPEQADEVVVNEAW